MKKISLLLFNVVAVSLLLVLSATNASAELGSADQDQTFTPVAPCRILDTRNTSILSAGQSRGFYVAGINSFQGQGGASGNCNLSKYAAYTTVVINFTVVNPSTGGYITAYPSDAPLPLAATVNFNAGDVVGNNATLKLNPNQFASSFIVYTTSQTHLVADVVGYFNPRFVSGLDCYVTPSAVGAINVPNSGRYLGNATAPACAAGYSSAAVNCFSSSPTVNLTGMFGAKCDANHFFNTATISASQRCCRIPGR